MTFAIRLVFDGSVCRESLQKSVADAASSHPLLKSYVRAGNDSLAIYKAPPTDLNWVPAEVNPVIHVLEIDDCDRPIGLEARSDRIDLNREIGFKTFISMHNGTTNVHFLFHHAACDGLGAFRFIEEVLNRYHAAQTQIEFPIPKVNSKLLKLRNSNCDIKLPWYRRLARSGFVLPCRIFGMVGQTPAKIAASSPEPDGGSSQPVSGVFEMPTVTLSEAETAAVSRFAAEHQSSTNELLLNQLFDVLTTWNQKSPSNETGKVRIIVPISLRNKAHHAMPAANCVSMVYVDAGNSEAELDSDSSKSLAGISKQLKYIRKWQIEYSWNQTANFAFRSKRIEDLLRKQSGRHLCTTVLSNLGQPFKRSTLPVREDGRVQVGDLTLLSAHIAAPTTTNTIATFAALFYAGRLTLTLNFNQAKISRADAQALMDLWATSLTGLK